MLVIYIILGLVALLLVLAALMPARYSVEKSIVINRPVSEVYNKVADLNFYSKWNPWHKMEPSAKTLVTGNPLAPGHKMEWQGKKIGEGSLTLKSLTAPKEIVFDLEFVKPWKSKADDVWYFESQGENATKVIWKNNGPLNFPTARLMGPMIVKNLNYQFVQGLNSLKELCEQRS